MFIIHNYMKIYSKIIKGPDQSGHMFYLFFNFLDFFVKNIYKQTFIKITLRFGNIQKYLNLFVEEINYFLFILIII